MSDFRKVAAGSFAAAFMMGSSAFAAGDLIINLDQTDPAPKKAFENIVAGFSRENPDVNVIVNTMNKEGYKTSIRNFLTAGAPDLATWYAGNRMAPFVNAGLFEDVTDVWEENGLNEQLKSAAASMTIDGKKWGVPYTYYQWGIYYRKDIFEEKGIAVPTSWDELVAASAKLRAAGIDPFTIGTKALWPTGGWFDYMNLRVNGYEFHMDLTAGKVPYTDPRVKATFDKWAELVKPGYYNENHAALDWQEAVPALVQGKAAMYLMGNFAVDVFRNGGLKDEQIGFMQFPEITPGIPMAEDAPTDTIHIPANAKNKEDARKFLAYMARADVQTATNITLGQLPVNSGAERPEKRILQQGFDMLSNAYALAQFYDRDASAAMAKAGMEGFQEFMVKPERIDAILERLEKIRSRVHD